MKNETAINVRIGCLRCKVEYERRDMQFADHGAYGQSIERIRQWEMEIEVLQQKLKALHDD